MNKRTLTICVVEELDQVHDAVNLFLSKRHKKGFEHVLFLYNIGSEEIDGTQFESLFPEPYILCLFNCDTDLLTLKEYGKDYLTANADAMVVAQQMVGVECELPKFYNFFKRPKETLYKEFQDAKNKYQSDI